MSYHVILSEVGGVSSSLDLPPYREIDFGFGCVCVACVRACDAKLRERDDSAVAGCGRLQFPGSVQSVRPAGPRSSCPVWPGWPGLAWLGWAGWPGRRLRLPVSFGSLSSLVPLVGVRLFPWSRWSAPVRS